MHDASTADETGGRTLEIFADTPRINAWMYARFAHLVRGHALEVGSGIGNLSRHLIQDAESAVLTDVEDHYLNTLSRDFAKDPRVRVARFNLEEDPPPAVRERPYQAILAVNVIEHVRDDAHATQNLADMLVPGGHLLVYVPAMPLAFGTLDEALGHHRRYTRASLRTLLSQAGLEPGPVKYMNWPGLFGWIIQGRLLKRRILPPSQVAVFERIVPIVSLLDHMPWPFGLGVYACARKP
jgi:SAM-dependent methyltransferase